MAARSPSSYDWTINESAMRPREPILGAGPSSVLDNQQFLLDQTRLIHTNVFGPLNESGATFVDSRLNRAVGVDVLGTGETRNGTGWVYCWSETSGTANDDFVARLTVDGTNYDLTVSNGDTTPAWREVSTAIALPNDNTYFSISIQVRVPTPGGSRRAYAGGIVLIG